MIYNFSNTATNNKIYNTNNIMHSCVDFQKIRCTDWYYVDYIHADLRSCYAYHNCICSGLQFYANDNKFDIILIYGNTKLCYEKIHVGYDIYLLVHNKIKTRFTLKDKIVDTKIINFCDKNYMKVYEEFIIAPNKEFITLYNNLKIDIDSRI